MAAVIQAFSFGPAPFWARRMLWDGMRPKTIPPVRRRRGQRGAAFAFVAATIFSMLAMGVVAVDLAHIGLTANEVQVVADAAATAGARTLLRNSTNNESYDAAADAAVLADANPVDGSPPPFTASDVELGKFDFTTRQFVRGGVPANAVRANATATVDNLLAGIFGESVSRVDRSAIAAHGGLATGNPVLPIVVGECKFNQYKQSGSCSSLPSLSLAPDPNDNSGWTSLAESPASAHQAEQYLPSECGGGGEEPPNVRIGQSVNVMNGTADTVLKTVKKCYDRGLRQFQIPIVACGPRVKFNQAMEVLGFATITISRVVSQGNPKGIDLSAICESETGPVGGGNFGTQSVALVK